MDKQNIPSEAEVVEIIGSIMGHDRAGAAVATKHSAAWVRFAGEVLRRYGQPAQPAASAEPVGEAQPFQPAVTSGAFTHCIFESKLVPAGTKLYAGPVSAQPSVPEGWKLVPVEPTEEMSDAGWGHIDITAGQCQDGPKDVYRAMLAAAPPADWQP